MMSDVKFNRVLFKGLVVFHHKNPHLSQLVLPSNFWGAGHAKVRFAFETLIK